MPTAADIERLRDGLAYLARTGIPATFYILRNGKETEEAGRVTPHPTRPRWWRVDGGEWFHQSAVTDIIPR